MSAPAPADIVGPESVVHGFTNAWNTHDMAAYDQLFTDAAVWVAVAESRVVGRTQIVDEFRDIHTSWAGTTTVVSSAHEIHLVRPDVAVVLFHSGYLDENGEPIPGVDRAVMLVAVQDGNNWKIAAGQVTKQSA